MDMRTGKPDLDNFFTDVLFSDDSRLCKVSRHRRVVRHTHHDFSKMDPNDVHPQASVPVVCVMMSAGRQVVRSRKVSICTAIIRGPLNLYQSYFPDVVQ